MIHSNGKSKAKSRTRADGDWTKQVMVEAALRTVSSRGYAEATARAIAAEGGFNSPLIFYHYGGVDHLLLAALARASDRRLSAYKRAMDNERDPEVLVGTLKKLWHAERSSPEIKTIQELVATPAFASGREREIAELMQPWFAYTEAVIHRVIGGSVIADFISPTQAAFLLVALLLGIEKMENLAPEGANVDALFDTAETLLPLLDRSIGKRKDHRPRTSIQRIKVD